MIRAYSRTFNRASSVISSGWRINFSLSKSFTTDALSDDHVPLPSQATTNSCAPENRVLQLDDENVQLTTTGNLPVTTKLEIINENPSTSAKLSCFRLLSLSGSPLPGAVLPLIHSNTARLMYTVMLRVQAMDDIFYNAQRQGRVSFYMQNSGEEAVQIGSASALSEEDVIFAQYRELGVFLWRGFGVQQCADQCFSNEADLGKGRQMPVHYGSRKLNLQTISSPLATQLPQAVGAGYALKLDKKDALPVCYFGEGAASEGDFHAAMNFASTLKVPMIFFCRNNGFAISTPTVDQYSGDGIASRASGYGMRAIRVDGNDLLAVHMATKRAREIALELSCPVLVEAMTYRRGHHSTSDDSTRYRSVAEINHWRENLDPVKRFRNYIEDKGWWSQEQEQQCRDDERLAVLQALETAERRSKPPLDELFNDVYSELPYNLIRQKEELFTHIEKYPENYDLNTPH